MAITSGFHNSINGDRKYGADFFALFFGTLIANGVFPNPSTGLQVVANSNMTTSVKAGKGWINGYFIVNDGDYVLQHDNADGVLKRIDRVVMKLNHVKREIEVLIKKGTFASSPVAPTLQRDTDYVELALADVLINNGATQITQSNITDQRLNTSLCGIVHGTVNQVDTTTIFNQYLTWFNETTTNATNQMAAWQKQSEEEFMEWFDSIKEILDGDVAGNLAIRITALESRMSAVEGESTTHKNDNIRHNNFAWATLTNNLITLTLDPAITEYKGGLTVRFRLPAGAINTGPVNIKINGLSQQPVRTNGNTDLYAGDMRGPAVYTLVYDGQSIFFLQGEGGGNKPEQGTKEFTTPGTYSWIVPRGVFNVLVVLNGAGGGGGGFFTFSGGGGNSGGGGGSGGIFVDMIPVTPGETIQIVVGTGGNRGTDGYHPTPGSSGEGGGYSKFKSSYAYGGSGGYAGSQYGNGGGGSGGIGGGYGGRGQDGQPGVGSSGGLGGKNPGDIGNGGNTSQAGKNGKVVIRW